MIIDFRFEISLKESKNELQEGWSKQKNEVLEYALGCNGYQ